MQLSDKEKIWMLGMIGASLDLDEQVERYNKLKNELIEISGEIEKYNAEILKEGSDYPENIYDIGENLAYKILESFKNKEEV